MAFRLAGTHISELGFKARLIDIPLLPEFSQETLRLPELQGALDLSKQISGRTLNFEIGLKTQSSEDFQQKLAALAKLLDQKAAPLILDIAPDRFIMARLKEAPVFSRIGAFSMQGTLSFYAADPFFYSIKPFEVIFSEPGQKSIEFTELKTELKAPVKLFVKSEGATTIHLNNYDGSLLISKTFRPNEILEYDAQLKTARINNGAYYSSALAYLSEPVFFEVDNQDFLSFTLGGDAAKLSVTVQVHGKWRTL